MKNRVAITGSGPSGLMVGHLLRQAGIYEVIIERLTESFSWQLTMLMHRFPDDGLFDCPVQIAELDYIASPEAAQRRITEDYVGLQLRGFGDISSS